MPGFLALLFFGGAAWGAFYLWQQHGRRAPIRELEDHREDLRDLSEMADLQENIDEEAAQLRARGINIDGEDKHS